MTTERRALDSNGDTGRPATLCPTSRSTTSGGLGWIERALPEAPANLAGPAGRHPAPSALTDWSSLWKRQSRRPCSTSTRQEPVRMRSFAVLQSQISMTPRGSYRTLLEGHLDETRDHSSRVRERGRQLGGGSNPLMALVGLCEDVLGQGLALSKTPSRPAAGLQRRGEGAQERQGRVRHRGAGDRDLHRDRATCPACRRRSDRAACGVDPRRRGADARGHPA